MESNYDLPLLKCLLGQGEKQDEAKNNYGLGTLSNENTARKRRIEQLQLANQMLLNNMPALNSPLGQFGGITNTFSSPQHYLPQIDTSCFVPQPTISPVMSPGVLPHLQAASHKRKFADISILQAASAFNTGSMTNTKRHIPIAPETNKRIKGELYLVKGERKRWDGRRFAKCCQVQWCDKLAQGTTSFCKNHGGGARCQVHNCSKAARGGSDFCASHGGGKRCTEEGCERAAIGGGVCRKHGGGKQCAMEECTALARGRTGLCVAHGGGARCKLEGCTKSARAHTEYCLRHDSANKTVSVPPM